MNKEWFYPTAYSVWGDEEKAAIDRVLSSGRFTQAEEVAAFEQEFAAWHDMKHAIMVNSGSSANLIAVAALFNLQERKPLQRSDRAMVPALAWSTTYAPLVQYGLNLLIADCNDSWNVHSYPWGRLSDDPAGELNLKLQVGCSILGNPAVLWESSPWYIIEDNCESLGAVDSKGHKCGTRGIMNTFSLFWSHQLSAIEGGVILTNDDECNRLCRMLRAHGWTRDLPDPVDRTDSFEFEYDFRVMGYNVRGLELHAAIAREQLKKLPDMIAARRGNVAHFNLLAMQQDLPLQLPVFNGHPSHFGIHFELGSVAPDKSVTEVRRDLARALRHRGIDCRLPTGGSFGKHVYGAPWKGQYTPRADRIHHSGMFLGNGPLDLTEQIERAVKVMREVL